MPDETDKYRVYFARNPLWGAAFGSLDKKFTAIKIGWHDLASEEQEKALLEAKNSSPANPHTISGYYKTREEAVHSLQKFLRKTRKRCTEILNSIVTDKHLDVEEAQIWASENGWDWAYRHQGWDWPSSFIRDEKVSVIWWDSGWACSVSPTGVFDNASFGSAITAMKMADKLFPRSKHE
jgi:hypothetical protein